MGGDGPHCTNPTLNFSPPSRSQSIYLRANCLLYSEVSQKEKNKYILRQIYGI